MQHNGLCKSFMFSDFAVYNTHKKTAMSRCKYTIFFSEIETFFKKNSNNTIMAVISALKVMKLTGVIPTLEIKHNTRMKTPERQMILLLLLFFGCMDASHPPQSEAGGRFSARYNMMYLQLCVRKPAATMPVYGAQLLIIYQIIRLNYLQPKRVLDSRLSHSCSQP